MVQFLSWGMTAIVVLDGFGVLALVREGTRALVRWSRGEGWRFEWRLVREQITVGRNGRQPMDRTDPVFI